jgi:hypothetical protein
MKFRVFTKAQPLVPEVFFKLIEVDGGVALIAVGRTGERVIRGNILQINGAGELYLFDGVSREIGLKLDSESRIRKVK